MNGIILYKAGKMIYEYECVNGHLQEEMHSMKKSPEIKCNECGKIMQRIISGGIGTIFKGGGWTTSDSNFKTSMKKKNEKMSKKMRDNHPSVSNINDLKNL